MHACTSRQACSRLLMVLTKRITYGASEVFLSYGLSKNDSEIGAVCIRGLCCCMLVMALTHAVHDKLTMCHSQRMWTLRAWSSECVPSLWP